MDIYNPSEVKKAAVRRLRDVQQGKKVAAVYAGLTLGLSALVVLLTLVLELLIDQSGGLGGMGRRTVLISLQNILPVIAIPVNLCLELGYQAAMLRAARGQYVSPQTLRLGFDRFWVLLRCVLLESAILFGTCLGAIYLGSLIFMMSPFSDRAMALLQPVLDSATVLNPQMVLDSGVYDQLMGAMAPAFVLCLVLAAVLAVPLAFRYRMAQYVIIDKPGIPAMMALRQSRYMMKGNTGKLLKLDISLWWYYGASLLARVLCYGDILLAMLGVRLPWSDTVSYYGFFAAYLAVQFAIYYFLRNRVETAYAIAYDSIRPKEAQTGGAVLGSIFQQ